MENAKTFFHVLWMAFVVGVLVGSLLTGDVGAQSMVKGSREPHCEAESKQRQQHGCVEGLPGLS